MAKEFNVASASVRPEPISVQQLFGNCDSWGAAEWFERLVNAVMEQDKAVVAGNMPRAETYRMIAASSAMELVRGYRTQVRAAIASPASPWVPVETAPKDRPILLWGPYCQNPCVCEFWSGKWVVLADGQRAIDYMSDFDTAYAFFEAPSHWMPPPPPPDTVPGTLADASPNQKGSQP